MRIIPICAWYAQTALQYCLLLGPRWTLHALENSTQLSKTMSYDERRVITKGDRKKYQFGIFFKRLKILNESESLRGPSDLAIKRNLYLTWFSGWETHIKLTEALWSGVVLTIALYTLSSMYWFCPGNNPGGTCLECLPQSTCRLVGQTPMYPRVSSRG